MKKTFLIVMLLTNILLLQAAPKKLTLNLINQWKHADTVYGFIVDPGFVIDENRLMLHFFRSGVRLVSKKLYQNTIPYGEGPSEAKQINAFIPINETEFAIVESPAKLKIFSPKEDSFVETGQKWIQRDYYHYFVRAGLFYKKRLFLAGVEVREIDNKPAAYHVKVYDEKGKIEKRLLLKKIYLPIKSLIIFNIF